MKSFADERTKADEFVPLRRGTLDEMDERVFRRSSIRPRRFADCHPLVIESEVFNTKAGAR